MAQQNTALVLIWLQELWKNKKSDYYLRNMDGLIDRACYLIQYAREMNYKIIFIRHIEKEWPFSDKDPFSQIIEDLCPQPEDAIIKKNKNIIILQNKFRRRTTVNKKYCGCMNPD